MLFLGRGLFSGTVRACLFNFEMLGTQLLVLIKNASEKLLRRVAMSPLRSLFQISSTNLWKTGLLGDKISNRRLILVKTVDGTLFKGLVSLNYAAVVRMALFKVNSIWVYSSFLFYYQDISVIFFVFDFLSNNLAILIVKSLLICSSELLTWVGRGIIFRLSSSN